MQRLVWVLSLLGVAVLAGCVVEPSPGTPAAPTVAVVPADARALRYGATAPEVFANPAMRDKLLALFGPDWSPAAQGGGRLRYGAANYFSASSPIRMIRMADREYIAISGCVPAACADHRGLVLIGEDGQQLWARIDEGGFARYYGHGPGLTGAQVSPTFIDGAWRAMQALKA